MMLFQMSVWYSFFLGDLAFLSEMDKQSKGGNIVVNEKNGQVILCLSSSGSITVRHFVFACGQSGQNLRAD